jgi:hypothetical protein
MTRRFLQPTAITLTLVFCLMCGLAQPAEAKIHRNAGARQHFKQLHPCPATGRSTGKCPGYVIDHVTPLACGGADHPANMQWQTVSDAKAKDKWERKVCHR